LIKSQDIPARDPSDQLVTVWSEEQARLTEIFTLALQIKTSLLISTDLYRCVYHPPGTIFDENGMEQESEISTSGSSRTLVVGFTLLPGLQRYAAGQRDLNFNRFVKDADVREQMTWETLYNPVVLIQQGDIRR